MSDTIFWTAWGIAMGIACVGAVAIVVAARRRDSRPPYDPRVASIHEIPDIITAEWLREHGACERGAEVFRRLFPQGAPCGEASIDVARRGGLSWHWFLGILPGEMAREINVAAMEWYAPSEEIEAEFQRAIEPFAAERRMKMRVAEARAEELRRAWVREHVIEPRAKA